MESYVKGYEKVTSKDERQHEFVLRPENGDLYRRARGLFRRLIEGEDRVGRSIKLINGRHRLSGEYVLQESFELHVLDVLLDGTDLQVLHWQSGALQGIRNRFFELRNARLCPFLAQREAEQVLGLRCHKAFVSLCLPVDVDLIDEPNSLAS